MSDEIAIQTPQDGIDLFGNANYQGFERIMLHNKNITPDFFDLKNGMAGEILQKFSTYRVRLAIISDFSNYESRSLQDFIRESNQGGKIIFVETAEETWG